MIGGGKIELRHHLLHGDVDEMSRGAAGGDSARGDKRFLQAPHLTSGRITAQSSCSTADIGSILR